MSLADNAREYHAGIVVPNIEALSADPDSKVASANAALSVSHMMDWVFNEKPAAYWAEKFPQKIIDGKMQTIKSAFRDGVEELHPGLVALRHFANGVKHSNMNADLLINPTWEECNHTWDQAKYTWKDAADKALLDPDDEDFPVQSVEYAVTEADAFWLGFMDEHGI